ncbi:unnamed protein product [Euphydryas editha]|uniref:Uncharacterized protein n=1 Tax=Euphydryas editha TaxID=104508 RepID=A0AAU9TMP1_EUPED|nr:unnamed protein product [Euphydryas editha]
MTSTIGPKPSVLYILFLARGLKNDEKIIELKEEMNRLQWDILGISEARTEGEDMVILEFGNLFYYRKGDYSPKEVSGLWSAYPSLGIL